MTSPGIIATIAIVLLFGHGFLVWFERRSGERLVFKKVRSWLDRVLDVVVGFVVSKVHYFSQHIIKLSWYYSWHRALRAVLTILVKAYDHLELVFIENRRRARQLRAEKRNLQNADSHIKQMLEHKEATALTSGEKKKLRAKKLERG